MIRYREGSQYVCAVEPGEVVKFTPCECGNHVFTESPLRFIRTARDGKPYVIVPDPLERQPGTP